MPDVKCKIVTTCILFYLYIIQLPVSDDELKQRLVEVWNDLQQNIIDSAISAAAQSTLGGQDIFAWTYVRKIYKMPEFYMIFALPPPKKNNNFPPNFEGARAPLPRLLRLLTRPSARLSGDSDWGRACVPRDDILSTCYEPVWQILGLKELMCKNYCLTLFITKQYVACG